MEQDLMNETRLLKDQIIDRIHDLVSMGDYLNATAVYEEFQRKLSRTIVIYTHNHFKKNETS